MIEQTSLVVQLHQPLLHFVAGAVAVLVSVDSQACPAESGRQKRVVLRHYLGEPVGDLSG